MLSLVWSCWQMRRGRLSADIKPAQVTLQAIPSILVDSPVPTPGLATLTLGHGVRGPGRDEPLAAAAAAGKSVGGETPEELRVLLGDLHDVLVDAEVCGLTSARLDHDGRDHVVTCRSMAA